MYQRRDYKDDEQITVGFKAFGKLATAVHEAAERSGYPSTTQWLRALARDEAARVLGVTPESLEPAPKRVRPGAAAPSPESAVNVAQVNAALLDAEATIKRLTEAMRMAGAQAPVQQAPAGRPSRRR
jgi:hypothetical protein